MDRFRRGKLYFSIGCILLLCTFCACSIEHPREGDWKPREYEVVAEIEIPEELAKQIHENREEPFYITYGEGKWLYICRGYGEKETGGYKVNVEEFCETEKFLYLDTSLIGSPKEEAEKETSYPYLVIRTARCEKQVAFT